MPGFKNIIYQQGGTPPPSSGEVTREQLRYDNYNKAAKAVEAVSAVIRVQEAQQKAVEFVTAAFAADLKETSRKAATKSTGVVTAVNRNIGERATDATRVTIARAEASKDAIERATARIAQTNTAKRALEDISNTVRATAAELAKRAVDAVRAAIVAAREPIRKATDLAGVVANYTGYANENISTTGWTNPANALGDTTTTAATLAATATGLAGTTSVTTTGTITLGLENPSPILGDLNITGPVTIEVERQITGAGTLPLGQSHNIAYEYQIAGAAGGAIGTPTASPSILIDRTQTYGDGCTFSGIRLPSANGTSNVLFVSGFTDSNTALVNPHPVPITNGQQGDLILLLSGGTNTGADDYTDLQRPAFLAAGYTELFFRRDTANGGAYSAVLYKIHGTSPEQTPLADTSNACYTYICFRNSGLPSTLPPVVNATLDATYPSTAGVNAGDILLIAEGGGSGLGQNNTARRTYDSVAPAITGAANNDFNALGYAFGCAGHYYTIPIPVAGWLPIGSDVGTTGSVAKGFVSTQVTINTLTDINNLQVRAVGTVVSGTGLGAAKTASLFRARVRLTASKDY